MVRTSDVSNPLSIIHVSHIGGDYWINKTSLSDFISDQDFYGYYVPKSLKNMTETDRNNVLNNIINRAQALSLLSDDVLGYNLIFQLWYNTDTNNNNKVDINEITSIRCDGLVEYCYEYYGLSVYESNISQFNTSYRNAHSVPYITPKQQIKHYLQNCLGDVNADSKIITADSRLILRRVARLEAFDEYQDFVSDVNGDNSVTNEDARLVLQYSGNLIESFPADPFPD